VRDILTLRPRAVVLACDRGNQMAGKNTRSDAVQPRYLSPQEFGLLSGLSLATVHRYLRDGRLPYCQPGGRRGRILIPLEALEMASGAAPGMAFDTSVSASIPVANTQQPETAARLPGPRPRWSRQAGSQLN
jgi:hypothetical protein